MPISDRNAPVLTAAEMRAAEAAVIAGGVPEYELMLRAGKAAAEIIWRAGAKRETLVLCGPGNNGGDGYVIAKALRDYGVPVRVAALADPATDSAKQARAEWGGAVEGFFHVETHFAQVVDALFGTGLTRGLEGEVAARLVQLVEAADRSYAIDIPSGIDADDGEILSAVPHYDLCIALGAWKRAHMLRPATGHWARKHLCDIGIPARDAKLHRMERPRLSPPADDAHKYTRGLVAAARAMCASSACSP